MINNIFKAIIYLVSFILSFLCLSGINFDKFMLPGNYKQLKSQGLLLLLSLGLAYLSGSFIITIMDIF